MLHMHNDPARRPLLVTALAALLQAVGGGLGWSVVPPLLGPIGADLKLDAVTSGIAWGAAPLGIALAAPLGGLLVDRHGPRRVAGLGMLLGALACGARAVAVGPISFSLAMLVFGAHVGMVAPSLPKALAGHVAPASVARANGLALLAYTLSTAIVVAVGGPALLGLFGDWRTVMCVAALAMAAAALVWLVALDDRAAASGHAGLRQLLEVAKHRELLKVALMHFCLFGGYLALLGTLPRALAAAGLGAAQLRTAIVGWLLAAASANFAGPWLSDRVGLRRPFFVLGAALAGSSLTALALGATSLAVPLLVLAALGGGCFAPLLLTAPLELPGIGAPRIGAAMGLLMLVGQLGGFLLPVASGVAAKHLGFTGALALLAVAHLAILLPAMALDERGGRAGAPTPGTPGAPSPAVEV